MCDFFFSLFVVPICDILDGFQNSHKGWIEGEFIYGLLIQSCSHIL